MYTVASPDPNPRGGGQLPNPNECNSMLTSGRRGIYPYLYIDEESVPCAKFVSYGKGKILYAGINFIQNHPPQEKPPGHDLKRAKPLPPRQSLCTKALLSGQNRESKAPPPGH